MVIVSAFILQYPLILTIIKAFRTKKSMEDVLFVKSTDHMTLMPCNAQILKHGYSKSNPNFRAL